MQFSIGLDTDVVQQGHALSSDSSSVEEITERLPLTTKDAYALYSCHALSTWNARMYEFSAILFTAHAFPNTLLMSSLRGLFTNFALLLFSSFVGSAIDRSRSRLSPLLTSVCLNRVSILLASAAWLLLFRAELIIDTGSPNVNYYTTYRICLFAAVVSIGIVERLSGVANMISVERDWVPTVALPDHEHGHSLTRLNTVMRRIDLICKLISPLVISTVIETTSTRSGVLTVCLLSGICLPIEIILAWYVWKANVALQEPKRITSIVHHTAHLSLWSSAKTIFNAQLRQLRDYFTSDVWQPSFALTLLHFSALSYSATFITFMLSEGFSLLVVTVARALGSVVEVSSTFVVPVGVRRLAICGVQHSNSTEEETFIRSTEDTEYLDPDTRHLHPEHHVGLARSGLWGLTTQCACLIPVVLAVYQISAVKDATHQARFPVTSLTEAPPKSSNVLTWAMIITIFLPLSFSRLGLWVFDLTTQEITQTGVIPSRRSSFAGTEMALSSFFELCQWVTAAIWNDPQDFRWLAIASFVAVSASLVVYARWVRTRRGHLVHWDRMTNACGCCTASKT